MNEIINCPDKLKAWFKYFETNTKNGVLSLDTETNGLYYTDDIVAFTFSFNGEDAIYVPVGHLDENGNLRDDNMSSEELLPILKDIAEKATKGQYKVIYANAKFDMLMILTNYKVYIPMFADVIIYGYVLGNTRKGLKDLSINYLGIEPDRFKDVINDKLGNKWKSEGLSWANLDFNDEEVVKYACDDAINTYNVFWALRPLVKKYKTVVKIEENIVDFMMRFTLSGVKVDADVLNRELVNIDTYIKELEQEIFTEAGKEFKIGSLKELRTVLFDELKLPVLTMSPKTGEPSTDKETMEQLSDYHPIIQKILDYRADTRMVTSYLTKIPNSLDSRGYLHGSFSSIGATSGRCTSQSVTNKYGVAIGLNLQNIPVGKSVDVRKAFVAPEGYKLVSIDFSQIEYRVIASLSGDRFLIDTFNSGADLHTATASALYGIPTEEVTKEIRQHGKTFNFGLMYGMTANTLAKRLGISVEQAEIFVENYFARTPQLVKYIEQVKQKVYKDEFVLTYFGRYRSFSDALKYTKNERDLDSILRRAFNTKIQGTAADLLKIAMLRVKHAIADYKREIKPILTVHDELDFYVIEDKLDFFLPLLKKAMEIPVPEDWAILEAEVSVGDTWSKEDLKEVEVVYEREKFTSWKDVVPFGVTSSLDVDLVEESKELF